MKCHGPAGCVKESDAMGADRRLGFRPLPFQPPSCLLSTRCQSTKTKRRRSKVRVVGPSQSVLASAFRHGQARRGAGIERSPDQAFLPLTRLPTKGQCADKQGTGRLGNLHGLYCFRHSQSRVNGGEAAASGVTSQSTTTAVRKRKG